MAPPDYASAIASIESGGQRDPYAALGPATRGDRAYGKYQIMGSNIGPWSKEILGAELTPEAFLASPAAQDAVFQGKFGQYIEKYGPEGAAQAWFGGPGGVGKTTRRDALGTSIGEYGQKFMAALGRHGVGMEEISPAPPRQIGPPLDLASFRVAGGMPAFPWSPGAAAQTAEPPPLPTPQIQYYRPGPLKRAFSFRG